MEPVIQGLLLVLDPYNIALIFGGVVIGVIVGALPGLSSPMALALLLPFTITLDPVPAICRMGGMYGAGTFGGSITAVLINAPGAPPASRRARFFSHCREGRSRFFLRLRRAVLHCTPSAFSQRHGETR